MQSIISKYKKQLPSLFVPRVKPIRHDWVNVKWLRLIDFEFLMQP